MKKRIDEFVCSMWLNINEEVEYEKITNHTNVRELEKHLKIFFRKKGRKCQNKVKWVNPQLRLPGYRNIKS